MTKLLRFDDPPIWSAGSFRGVTSKIDAFFAVQSAVTRKDLEEFSWRPRRCCLRKTGFGLARGRQAACGAFREDPEHSERPARAFAKPSCCCPSTEMIFFGNRLGVSVSGLVNGLIRKLLTPVSAEKLHSQSNDLPLYAEAAPSEFLRIIEVDLRSPEPQTLALMKPAKAGIFGGDCPRTGLLWALESLAWKPELTAPRHPRFSPNSPKKKIDDNWMNRPENSLKDISGRGCLRPRRHWMIARRPLEALTQRFPAVGWQVCLAQFGGRHGFCHRNHRPRWRDDATGAGQPREQGEAYEFQRKALDLALA